MISESFVMFLIQPSVFLLHFDQPWHIFMPKAHQNFIVHIPPTNSLSLRFYFRRNERPTYPGAYHIWKSATYYRTIKKKAIKRILMQDICLCGSHDPGTRKMSAPCGGKLSTPTPFVTTAPYVLYELIRYTNSPCRRPGCGVSQGALLCDITEVLFLIRCNC